LSLLQALTPEDATNVQPLPPQSTTPITSLVRLPLLVAIDQGGDGFPTAELRRGFTPLPDSMALGATWDPRAAETVGAVVGQESAAVGINLLFGPSLDVLDTPRINQPGDLGTRTFGGNPYWVGLMGQAYIRGVHEGSAGRVATVAKHFPGQGASDRRPDEEIATVQKPLALLRQVELAPFAAVAHGDDAAAVTEAFMSSHVRYRGFQDNTRQLTPPISLAPQLQTILALEEFKGWRKTGGILVSDALGVPSIRRYYDPSLQKFPHRQVALDAFVTGGNDILLLSQFALTDDWDAQVANIKDTLLFFQERYTVDEVFRERVNAALLRILRLKRRLYPALSLENALVTPDGLSQVGQNTQRIMQIAQAAATLIDPGLEELADRLPAGPLADENILIIADARQGQECEDCPPFKLIDPLALETIMLRLYGPQASAQVDPKRVRSLSFVQLMAFLQGASEDPPQEEIERLLQEADWIIFAMLDVAPLNYPESTSLKQFLSVRSDSLRDKRLIVFSFSAPYYLDPTEISKLTAYFGLYSKTPPFLETAVRLLFREYTPQGRPPVSIPAINYNLSEQVQPNPQQVIGLRIMDGSNRELVLDSDQVEGEPVVMRVGQTLRVATGLVTDHNRNLVPDGTAVTFRLLYPTESLELPRQQSATRSGIAEMVVKLERPGELQISATAGTARQSDVLVITIEGATPTATATPTSTPLPTPSPTPTPTTAFAINPSAEDTPKKPAPRLPRVDGVAFLLALLAASLAGFITYALQASYGLALHEVINVVLWGIVMGMAAYVFYGLGWLPGATYLQQTTRPWGAAVVTLAASLLPLLVARTRLFLIRLGASQFQEHDSAQT
jgi:beta-N-acetylhexosaminidase